MDSGSVHRGLRPGHYYIAVRASGNADLEREFHVVDTNHNGRLTKEEMKGWLK